MSESVTIRVATPADALTVSTLYLVSRRYFLPYAPVAHTDDAVHQWVAQDLIPSGKVSVAVVDNKIVGMMALSDDGTVRWIQHLYLLPDVVNHGIGTLLLRKALQELKPPVHLYTFQKNTAARRFYEQYGFQPIAFGDGSDNEEQCPDVLYEWQGNGGT
ncbi:MAG: GNAT family N-acetyltransferase [Chloroflexi bacterium AL-W]|nr:GNAT family N-acetyltransferase [Chloroflexi bacterium AL-N1]NOK70945.1 GNAT family N-acetyltransferase [Chloroflexi bacterium AL-N10]NOK73218.1 GNAT family N-acetyltransferase [Chloroflexi bacterium AL-N5]NOK80115.1 GNAT family N-acetyltransferase [Chloroflexi bacterium AL-W]NOK88030.1 GNAT family N-acetyltransferase [Chloroflexi bacterium AL-N15]